MFSTFKEFITAIKTHTCHQKKLFPSDDPSNDIWEANSEGRAPSKYPTTGFTCECGEDFRINLKDVTIDGLPPDILPYFQSAEGKKRFCEVMSLFNGV